MFGRTPLGNRRVHGVVGYACSPTMQTPSPTQKPLAGMHASAAAAERVFSAQPIVQETESARGTDEKDERRRLLAKEADGLATAAARPSRRAGRPKPRHAKVGAAMPTELGHIYNRDGGKRKEHPVSPGLPVRSRPAPPGQGTANGRGFAVRGTSGRSIRPCFSHRRGNGALPILPYKT